MSLSDRTITSYFEIVNEGEVPPVAAAILVLADAISNFDLGLKDRLSHELAIGIRQGIFGVDASDSASLPRRGL